MAYAATTTARDTAMSKGDLVAYKMTAVKIMKGVLAHTVIASGHVSNIVPAATDVYVGVTAETVDNSAGAAGGKTIDVYATGVHMFNATGTAAQSWVGKPVYWSTGTGGDDTTVVLSAPGSNKDVIVGRCVEYIDATHVRVRIDGYTGTAVA